MKKIEAILQHSKLNEVQRALQDIGIDTMTVSEVRGFGRQNRHVEIYRSQEHVIDFLPKIKIDLVVSDEQARQALRVLVSCARKRKLSDDQVFVSDIKEADYLATA